MTAIVGAVKQAQNDLDGSPGSKKLDYAVDQLNALIDIPLLPEHLEELILKTAITIVVELAKTIWGDKGWFVQLTRVFDTRQG